MDPLVSIIIVNWNGLSHLQDCLASLAAQTFRNFEVVLVDNGSEDGSVAFVGERFPWVKVFPLQENTGFASGNNKGFEQAHGDYIVTLNNDTRVEPDWLQVLVDVARSNSEAGMVGCRICSFDDPDLIDSLGMGICPDGMSRGRFRGRRWSALKMGEVEEILFPSACAALYKRSMLEGIGFFDDDFFAYAEDSDLGLRGRLSGWSALIATRAIVYHKYSQSSGGLSPLKVYLVERNHYWVALKNFPPGMLLALPFFTIMRYLEQARSVLGGEGTGGEFRGSSARSALLGAVVRGGLAALAGLPRMLGKRRAVMRARQMPKREYARLMQRYRISFRELLDNYRT